MKHNRRLSNQEYLYSYQNQNKKSSVQNNTYQTQEKQNQFDANTFTLYRNKIQVKSQAKDVPKAKLNNENYIPLIGFGTWKISPKDTPLVVYNAIKMGYRHIDCAPIYGNQKEVGQGIALSIKQGIVKRQDLFVTSKLWSSFHRPQNVIIGLKKSLEDLGLEYIDLYLMHNSIALKYVPIEEQYPTFWYSKTQGKVYEDDVSAVQTYKAMQKLVKQGLVKTIGVSNFNVMLLRQLYNSVQIKPAVVQNQLHPYLNQKIFVKYCKSKNIHVTSYSTLGGASYVQLQMAQEKDIISKNQIITQLAQIHNKTPTQIILKWAIQQEISIIPKSTNITHMMENINLNNWQLTQYEMKKIDNLNINKRFLDLRALIQIMSGDFLPFFQ